MKKKIVKRKYWSKKKNDWVTKTYAYEVTTTNEGKQKFTRLVTAKKKKQTPVLDEKEIQKRINMIDGEGLKKTVRNRVNQFLSKGNDLSFERLEQFISQEQISKQEQFIRNLGYTKEEFAKEFNLTEQDLLEGKFEDLGGGEVKFTSKKGKVTKFSWDYDGGVKVV